MPGGLALLKLRLSFFKLAVRFVEVWTWACTTVGTLTLLLKLSNLIKLELNKISGRGLLKLLAVACVHAFEGDFARLSTILRDSV